jgi:chemotaxis protein methyltransferase CheR
VASPDAATALLAQGSLGSLDAAQMTLIARIAAADAGIVIAPAKASMVQSRLAHRLRALGLGDYGTYLALVETEAGRDERRRMISALTTNVTHFFREMHHFDTLRDHVLPGLVARARKGGRVRFWSAGCSTGQEPYSIATLVVALCPEAATLDIRILATDIDQNVIARARTATYDSEAFTQIDPRLRDTGFQPAGAGQLEARPAVRDLVRFQELNLLQAWPMRGVFDAIFCRNVVIYFSAETQAALWPRFGRALDREGWFFVGHSERVATGPESPFVPAGITTYRRRDAAVTMKGR